MCCSWNRWEGGERKKAGKKTVPQFFHGKKPFMLLFFLPLRSGPFSGPLSLSASAPPPPPLPSKAGRKKGHGKKGWRINIIRVVFAAAASLENRKGGGEQKKDLPSVRQKSHSPTGLLSSLYVCNLGLQEVGGAKN